MAQEAGAVVNYIELDAMGRLTLENNQKAITDQQKLLL